MIRRSKAAQSAAVGLWFDLASLPAGAAIHAGETRYFQFLFP